MQVIVFLAVLGVAAAGGQLGFAAAPAAVAYSTGPQLSYAAQPAVHYAAAAPVVARAYGYQVAPVVHAAPAIAVKTVQPEPFDPNPQYNYGYSVQDGLTGDSKTHSESRNGDVVQGSYSLVEPDGAVRTVTYTADSVNGFNAVVDRSAPAVAVAKVHAAPVAVARAAPLAVAHHGYAAAAPLAVAHHGYAAAAPLAVAHHGYAAAAPLAVAHHGYAAAAPLAVAHHGYAAAAPLAVAHHGYAAAPLAVAHHGYSAPLAVASHGYAASPVAFRKF